MQVHVTAQGADRLAYHQEQRREPVGPEPEVVPRRGDEPGPLVGGKDTFLPVDLLLDRGERVTGRRRYAF
ncbi:hypothetical protein AB0M50_19045 [Nonomuraea fuscirosea]|uniref:hypothetical protein n=1 Tax=Nonomuraea fuscirosea TaxID=1291556 RepID=UPI00344474CC